MTITEFALVAILAAENVVLLIAGYARFDAER
jgi:hypothetical protein